FLYSIKLFPLRWINSVSLSLLLFLSPAYGAFWLLIVTFYFLFKGNFKNIFIIWGLFLGTWYLFFIVCLSDYESQILIGGEHTKDIMMYFSYKYSACSSSYYWYTGPFQGFCYQTVILLHLLSAELGFALYIPSVFIG
ncbi:unnamed protein product, partial [Ectocarpus sp. 4 AP-2014]